MTPVFADTFYFLALLNAHDSAHSDALRWASNPRGPLVTTAWVLTELADAMSAPRYRLPFLAFVSKVRRANGGVEIVPASADLFDRGLDLFGRRLDKAWSLTDCISFVVMTDRGLGEALTGDQHFEQAGFRALLRA
jgi:predicted nucleic acid-binding protein